MKKIIYGVASFCLFGCSPAFSVQTETLSRMNDLQLQAQQLQSEVDRLGAELERMKQGKKVHVPHHRHTYSKHGGLGNSYHSYPSHSQKLDRVNDDAAIEAGFSDNSREFNEFTRMWGSPRNTLLLAAIGSTVTTSPFLGLRSAFDASDLIVNLPTMNEDLRFLKEHVLIDTRLSDYGVRLPDRPIIELGGKIEGIVFAQEDWNQGRTTSDIDIGSVRLDVLVEVSKGVHGFMALNMDNASFDLLNNSSLDIQLAGSGSRVFNSRVFISRAFVTLGDLNCTPYYFTIGQMFVPFGRYASNMVTSPLTVELGRINERAILLGYYNKGLFASFYGFRGDSNVASSGINAWGTNWGYEKNWKDSSMNIGGGYVGNIADSTGMEITGAPRGFFGFGLNAFTENLEHRVPAYDIHGEFSYKKVNFFAEYIWTDQAFAVENLMYNGAGAQPTASNFELAYNFKLAECPASLAVGYGWTTEALALNLPENSFIAAFNISIWKDTIQSLEFRHDNNYDSSDFAGGNGAIPAVFNSFGGSRNTYTAQIGIYF